MVKNSKAVKRELDEDVKESVKDLLSHEDACDDSFKKTSLIINNHEGEQKECDVEEGGSDSEDDERPAWNSKLQYILAQVGFSVGLGNVWRFPYLCQKNGGGAYLIPYIILLVLIGIPLFFLELAVGQRIRRGSIGVWNYISPRLGGIGFASCVVCFFVALYYNVIISWSLFYFSQSFQQPLPWSVCPLVKNRTHVVPECEKSSATTFYWYRKALDISDDISEGGGLNWKMTVSLLAAWILVCLAMIKGIQSSGKVMYFSSLFPYVVLICFLVRALLLTGSMDGIRHMFTPKLEIMLEPKVWREAATQVFFALGLGFGGVIAFSSYNKRTNNCHFDAVLVSFINFFTSVLATLVVFAVLGFKANVVNTKCIMQNTDKLVEMLGTSINESMIPHSINLTKGVKVSDEDYHQILESIKGFTGSKFKELGLEPCSIEDELNKAVHGTGLAFIAFTEAMTHFPASPFWSVMFFLMLVNLGLGSMFGTIEGILTPLIDTTKVRKEFLTVGVCVLAFSIGLVFVQRSGNYFVTMFDDYSATLPLLIVVILENVAVAWFYGIDRFFNDLKDMLGFTPYRLYYYLWKYITPILLLILMVASFIQLIMTPPSYNAWIEEEANEQEKRFPTWGTVICISLVVLAILPVPLVFILRYFNIIEESNNSRSTVAYKKGRIISETPQADEDDDTSLIHGKAPSETPSPMPSNAIYRKQSGSDVPEVDNMPNGRYGIGYLMADRLDVPESDL